MGNLISSISDDCATLMGLTRSYWGYSPSRSIEWGKLAEERSIGPVSICKVLYCNYAIYIYTHYIYLCNHMMLCIHGNLVVQNFGK